LNNELVLVTIEATSLVQEILDRLQALPPAMIHIGHSVMAAAAVQALNDPSERESIEMQWKTDGLFGDLTAAADGFGQVRASMTNAQVMSDHLETSLGRGTFSCRKVKNHIVSSGIIESTGKVNTDIEDYFRQSEQRRCALGLSVKLAFDPKLSKERPFFVEMARAYLIHFLPEEDGVSVARMQALDTHLQQLGPLSQWVIDDDPELATATMAKFITGTQKVRELHETNIELKCRCTKERVLGALNLLTTGERKHLFEADKNTIEVKCEFCGKDYTLSKEDLDSFLADAT